jgi:hypothetical protein
MSKIIPRSDVWPGVFHAEKHAVKIPGRAKKAEVLMLLLTPGLLY